MLKLLSAAALVLVLISAPLASQQRVPMIAGTPVAPNGLVVSPLPNAPVTFKTAEGPLTDHPTDGAVLRIEPAS